ncbi:37S ribosomal protein MRP13, mitochondrial [Wickerhamomyces ciferrii]|uniref:37S ribosomal protein MRP13, mitochondrial n=1 Tax=Wickerhamomyces ciferrii (strain ATCC 14091 / BCRC 22168 / CBS 111 / JCM 3599 / NBRC 0793 / NRRL Y-1031 F-60-10) TaxID=1206466 RepID=K0KJC3_WICCF|nr:37S ribosomal protein MRP13, mitochondrial [Wickerhamomyces ciferrii]CCH45330.1 37S ribosomal protein MRP13, mitochondrial [Wickerhamomyces ciferrii]
MLRFTRGISTSRCLLQEISTSTSSASTQPPSATEPITPSEYVTKSKEHYDSYVRYLKTSRRLRLLMYRPRHSQELLSRDLIDPLTNKRARPSTAPGAPSSNQIAAVIRHTETQEELNEISHDLISLLRKNPLSVTPYVLNELAIKNAEFGNVGTCYQWLFSHPKLENVPKAENLNMFLTFLYLNPFKGYTNVTDRISKITKQTTERDLITDYLTTAIMVKHGKTRTTSEIFGRLNKEEIDLPLDVFTKSIGHQANLHHEADQLYVTLKPIATELINHKIFKNFNNFKKIVSFVEKYENLTETLNKTNRFEEIKAKSKFYSAKNETKVEPTESTEAETEAPKDA